MVRSKVLSIFILFAFFSCAKKKEHKEFYPNGHLKLRISLDENSVANGIYEEYYDSGELKEKGSYLNGEVIDTVYAFYKNGVVEMKGKLQNGKKNGWWTFYDENGNLKKRDEYVDINGGNYENQTIKFNSNGNIDYDTSSFFEIDIADTIEQGKSLGKLNKYYSNFDVDRSFIWVVIENQYSENRIKKDTFSDGTLTPHFGIFGFRPGKQLVKGTIVEEFITEDSSSLKIIKHKKYFEREVFVKDTLE